MMKHRLAIALLILLTVIQSIQSQNNDEDLSEIRESLGFAISEMEISFLPDGITSQMPLGTSGKKWSDFENIDDDFYQESYYTESLPLYPNELIRSAFKHFYSVPHCFVQRMESERSSFSVPSYLINDFSMIKDNLGYTLHEDITSTQLFFRNGETEVCDEATNRQAIAEMKFVDSIAVSIDYEFPLDLVRIKLNKDNVLATSEFGDVELIAFGERYVEVRMPMELVRKVNPIQGSNKYHENIMNAYASSTKESSEIHLASLNFFKGIVDDIDQSKLTSIEEALERLMKGMMKIEYMTDAIPKAENVTIRYYFPQSVSDISFHYTSATGKGHKNVVLTNKNLSLASDYHVATDYENDMGLVDNNGKWIASPIYDALAKKGTLYYNDIEFDKDYMPYQITYKLNPTTRKLEECKYTIKEKFDNNLLAVGTRDSNLLALSSYDMNLVTPMIYSSISLDKDASLFRVSIPSDDDVSIHRKGVLALDGREILPAKYYYIEVDGDFIYAIEKIDGQMQQMIFDKKELPHF